MIANCEFAHQLMLQDARMSAMRTATAASGMSAGCRQWAVLEIFLNFFVHLSIGPFLIRRVGEEAEKPFSNSDERTDL